MSQASWTVVSIALSNAILPGRRTRSFLKTIAVAATTPPVTEE